MSAEVVCLYCSLSTNACKCYRPLGAARELFRRRDPEIVLSGPAGTGKSRAVLEKLHACAEKYDGCRLLIIRKTRSSLTSTGVVTYTDIVMPPGAAEVTYQQATYPNGSVISFGGMDKPSKIMSSEYDIIYVQEATELTEDDWESLTTRLRWGRLPYQQMIGDCNPSAPSHWLKKRAQAGRLIMMESRHEDNPYLWSNGQWTEKGKAYIAKLDALTGVRHDRLRLGSWAAAKGAVYSGYNPAIHLIDREDIPQFATRIWTVDFGYTNPFVWQAWAIDHDGRMIRYREIYHTQRLVEDHVKTIIEAVRGDALPDAIICDHDAEDRATLERHLGVPTTPAMKAVSPGIQAVQQRLRIGKNDRPRIVLMRDSLVERDQELVEAHKPTCTEEEIESYTWAQGIADKTADAPVKRDDHGLDAMRYAVCAVDDIVSDNRRRIEVRDTTPYLISPV